MKTVKFWKVETPYETRYFEDETAANRMYYKNERATITSFVRRNPGRITAIRDKIDRDKAIDTYYADQMHNLDAQAEAWLKANRGDE